MSEFSELVKRFDKIRSYVRDFYINGFKTRADYTDKSSRTYDNERRRIESWFSGYIRREYRANRKKSVFITMDSSRIESNPLYHVWKIKSFTANDIMLHFFLLDLLRDKKPRDVETITDDIQRHYQVLFDTQTVRRKLVEYTEEGLVTAIRTGRRYLYTLEEDLRKAAPELMPDLMDAVCFFQAAAPFGFIGSTILDFCQTVNRRFRFRHDFLVHTLEDEVLLPVVKAIHDKCLVTLTLKSAKTGSLRQITGTPLKILVSTQTGRRYVCVHKQVTRRLISYRLDRVCHVEIQERYPLFEKYLNDYEKNAPAVWGVSFGTNRKPDEIRLQVALDEITERHIITRLEREGRGGSVLRIGPGIYEYTATCWDAAELLPWIRTFIGRIVAFTCTNEAVEQRFWDDIKAMQDIYQESQS